ncbi:MAG: hypothetical protein FWD67_12000 [Betaproteobacteria bacterium]|nr:hypothetical protein [Betaproteobacteria bacterium]
MSSMTCLDAPHCVLVGGSGVSRPPTVLKRELPALLQPRPSPLEKGKAVIVLHAED